MSGSDQIDPLTATLRGISWACFGPLEASAGQPERLHQTGATSVWLAEAVQDATGDSVKLAFVDQGYTGERAADGAKAHGIEPEVVTLPEAKNGFVLLPRRWVVQRSCAWTIRFRRLARDYEHYADTLAGMHRIAFVCLMLKQAAQLLAGP